ncbi:hypothetical protein ACFXTH_030855 [Malus domestica]
MFSDPRWDDAGYGTQAYFDLPLDVYAQRELEFLESLNLKKCRGMNYLDIRGKNFELKLKTLVVLLE